MLNTKEHSDHISIFFAGFISAIAYSYLSLHSQKYGQTDLADLYLTSSIVILASMTAWSYCHYKNISISFKTVFLWAIVFRVIGMTGFPVLEDDFFRYLWDGYQLVENGSPYTHPPITFFTDEQVPDRFVTILDGINYPHINTVYAPVTQWIFALSYLIAPGEVWPLQIILSLLDLLLIITLSRIAEAKYILLYAWNPLIIKEVAFTAHPDIIGVFFIMLGVILSKKHIYLTAFCCALAAGSKVFAIIIIPLLLGFNWRAWALFLASITVIYMPFIKDILQINQGLFAMADSWLFNAPIYLTLGSIIPTNIIKVLLLTFFTAVWAAYVVFYYSSSFKTGNLRGDILFGLFFLSISVMNPWYLIWLLPFAVLYPTYWAWTSSVAILLSYVIGLNIGTSEISSYDQPLWAVSLEFLIIGCALCIDIKKKLTA